MAYADDAKAGADDEAAKAAIAAWTAERRDVALAARKAVEEIEASGGAWSFAKLTIANAALRELANVEAK